MLKFDMPRSRRFRKNQTKPEWGKNNPQTKAKNRKMLIAVGIIAVAIVAISAFVVLGQNTLFAAPASTPTPTPSPSPTPYVIPVPEATPATSPSGEYSATGTRVLMTVQGTDSSGKSFIGNITIQMRDDKPITTTNFVNLVKEGFYDGSQFHRVDPNFMIQGGKNATRTIDTINDEIGNDNHNVVGTIAMAKTSDPNSATNEFFINVKDNSQIVYSDGTHFDATYTVFGKVISGMDVVNSIAGTQVQPNPQMNNENSQPVNPVTVLSAIVLP